MRVYKRELPDGVKQKFEKKIGRKVKIVNSKLTDKKTEITDKKIKSSDK